MFGLERTGGAQVQVRCLLFRHLTQTNAQVIEVSSGDLLVELEWPTHDVRLDEKRMRTYLLGQDVDTDGVFVVLGVQLDLGEDLVGERVAHHKAWVAMCATYAGRVDLSLGPFRFAYRG